MAIVTGIVVPGSIGRSQALPSGKEAGFTVGLALPLMVDVTFKGSRLIAFCFGSGLAGLAGFCSKSAT